MKIGIMSDSHDNIPKIRAAIELFNRQEVELVIHAGDLVSPFAAKELRAIKSKFIVVFGNNDGERLGLARMLEDKIHLAPYQIKADDKTVLVCHEPYALKALEQSNYYDAIIYGHTHDVDVRKVDSTQVINPGECGGWLNGKCTVAVWDTKINEVEVVEI